MSFWTDVTFINQSGESIIVTPIGITEGGKEIGPLHTMKTTFFWEHAKNRQFHINENESLKISYDMDDQNLQFLIIEFSNDDIRILFIDRETWNNTSYKTCCATPDKDKYYVPSKSEIPLCPKILQPTIQGEYVKVNNELITILKNL